MTIKLKLIAIPIAAILFISLSTSCGKKWKQTTTANFQFNITKSVSTDFLQFTGGQLIVHEVDFSGDRNKGGGVDFQGAIANGSTTDFATGTVTPSIHYDIPQGTYSRISLSVKTQKETGTSSSIVLNGKFIDGANDTIPVLFKYNVATTFNVDGKTNAGSSEINLVEGTPSTCQIGFNPAYWFSLVTHSMLDNAQTQVINHIPTIVISEDENDDIYNYISNRITQTTTAVFN